MFQSSNTTNHSNVILAMTTNESFPETTTVRVIKGIVYFILFWWSLVGNFLVIAIVYRNKEMRTTINYMIVNMAMSDLLFTLVTIAEDFVRIISGDTFNWVLKGDFGNFCCKVNYFIIDVSVAVSVFTMLIIASQRFRAAVFPMKPALIQKDRCAVAIAIIWIISGLLYVANLYRFKLQSSINGNKVGCTTYWDPPIDGYKADRIMWFITICYIAVSFVLMAVLYLKIFFSLRERETLISRLGSTNRPSSREQTSRRVNSVLFVVVIVFFLTWTPTMVYFSLTLYLNIVEFQPNVGYWIFFLTRTYQAINPCIYFVFNRAYRQGLLDIVRCRKRSEKKYTRSTQLFHSRNNSQLSGRVKANLHLIEMHSFDKEMP